jgi:hypothetical protein
MSPDWEQMQNAQEVGDVANSLGQSVPMGQPYKPDRNLPDWYMEFEDDLKQMEHWLKGEYFDETDTNEPWKQMGTPLINRKGAVFILGYLRGTGLSKNKIMTNFPNWDQAMMRIRGVCFALNETLHKHYCDKDWDLSLANIRAINEYAFDLVFATTLRALHGNENRRIRETSQTSTNIVQGQNPSGQGFDPTRPKSPLDSFLGR